MLEVGSRRRPKAETLSHPACGAVLSTRSNQLCREPEVKSSQVCGLPTKPLPPGWTGTSIHRFRTLSTEISHFVALSTVLERSILPAATLSAPQGRGEGTAARREVRWRG